MSLNCELRVVGGEIEGLGIKETNSWVLTGWQGGNRRAGLA